MGLFMSAEQKAEKDYKTGYEALYHSHASNRHEKAEKYLGRAAQAGHVKAMFHYGQLLDKGEAGPNALEWALKAAEAGFDDAIKYCVGYYSGTVKESRPKQIDWEKAVYWAKRGVELGIRGMDAKLAEMEQASTPEGLYQQGLELAERGNYKSAMKKMEQAGREGYAPAMLWCAKIYETGMEPEPYSREKVYRDEFYAAEWYKRAAEAGEPEGLRQCVQLYKDGKLERLMDSSLKGLIDEYDAATAALSGDAPAAERLLERIEQGYGKGAFFTDACQRKAQEGDAWAGCLCAELKRLGKKITLPDQRLLHCCEQTAKEGVALGQYIYGRLLEQGRLAAQDKQKALFWYESAARAGNERASLRAAEMYLAGEGCKRDLEKGRSLLRGVSKPGLAAATLARALLEGDAAVRDPEQACALYTEAARDVGAHVRLAGKESTEQRLLRLGQALYTRRQYRMAMPLLRYAAHSYIAGSFRMAMLYHRGLPGLLDADYEAAALRCRTWYYALDPGDVVRFGSYPQHSLPEAYKTVADNDPVFWQVLKAEDGRALLLCSAGLEYAEADSLKQPLFDAFEQPFVEKGPFNLTEEEFNTCLAGKEAVPVQVQASVWATVQKAESLGLHCSVSEGRLKVGAEQLSYITKHGTTAQQRAWEEKKQWAATLTQTYAGWRLDGDKLVLDGKVQPLKEGDAAVLRPAVWVRMPPPPKQT